MKTPFAIKANTLQPKTVRVERVSEIYDIPLNTLRKWISRDEVPGLIRRAGGRRIYVDLKTFDEWFRLGAIEDNGEVDEATNRDANGGDARLAK